VSRSKFCAKKFDCLIAKVRVFEAWSRQIKKLQITHRIYDGLGDENPREIILTTKELIEENSQDIQTFIKKLND